MNKKLITNFDTGRVFATYKDMEKQFEQVFDEFKGLDLSSIKNVNKILVCGMGGSALGPDFVRSVFLDKISVPIIISNEYELPTWVDDKTLVVISSFSGTTEESINCFKEAKKKKFQTFIITTGGDLAKVESLKFVYDPKYNYAKNPRFAVGYSIACFISLFSKLGFLKYDLKKMKQDLKVFARGKLVAEKVAKNIQDKFAIIISSEHLGANAHIFQNQLNETGKNFASYFHIPEICHHQFEGLSFPHNLNKQIVYVLINSSFYNKRNQKRYEIMKEILNKKKIKFIEIKTKSKNIFEESIYVLGVSSYTSFYLAYFNNIDPQPNPWVDYLKNRLKK